MQLKMGGKFHLKLNTGERPIANKYREGKMKRTLKRELKGPEIVSRETIETGDTDREFSKDSGDTNRYVDCKTASCCCLPKPCALSLFVRQHQFELRLNTRGKVDMVA